MPDTPLNPDALENAADVIWMNTRNESGVCDADRRTDDYATIEAITSVAIKEYLAVAQPEVNSVEELDQLPHETVIRDSEDFVFERIVQHGKDPEWWSTTDFLNETKVTLPARVLYRPVSS